ncbi:hypothetical protein [Streptosporangium roseum]|uniref:hypothetical protein n=1 Tax=Streptosporangium roseum TaxID=2001 RepID=UPI003324DE05
MSRRRKKLHTKTGHPSQQPRSTVIHLGSELPSEATRARTQLASEKAAEMDRVWFERNPGVDAYAREAVLHEHDAQLEANGWEETPGTHLVVIVEQVVPGRRLRHPFNVYRGAGPDGHMTDEQLAEILDYWRLHVYGKEVEYGDMQPDLVRGFLKSRHRA